MDRFRGIGIADRFAAYVGELTKVVGHADRAGPLRDYCSGLLATEGRRSVEPMAAVTAPARVSAQHQKLLHFVANAEWSDEQMLAKVRDLVTPSMTRRGPIEAWIIDDTSFPKKGRHSVGVHHQYCGQLGKQANCQVAVTLSIANRHGSLPIAYRLYLPRAWTGDKARRAEAHVPRSVRFKTKPRLALEQIRTAVKAKVARGAVLMDAGYGTNSGLAGRLRAWGWAMWQPSSRRSKCARCARIIGSRSASASKPWRAACPRRPGAPSRGETAATRNCDHALLAYACVPPRYGAKRGLPKRHC
jgi:SRSO17 transposase